MGDGALSKPGYYLWDSKILNGEEKIKKQTKHWSH